MQEIKQIGKVLWEQDKVIKTMPSFLNLYSKRPIKNNNRGMKIPHAFATWYIIQKIKPQCIIESGVWKGQSTWLLEKTLPNATIFSIDPFLDRRIYKSSKAKYFNTDFNSIQWDKENIDKSKTLLFFDDHQNAVERVKQSKRLDFKHIIFEDNQPPLEGDFYSLKKAFANPWFKFYPKSYSLRKNIVRFLGLVPKTIISNPCPNEWKYLKEVLEIYYEFPPLLKTRYTYGGHDWENENFPTPKPLFKNNDSRT